MNDRKLPGWVSALIILAGTALLLLLIFLVEMPYPYPLWLNISAGVVLVGLLTLCVVSGYRYTHERAQRELRDCLQFAGVFIGVVLFMKHYLKLDQYPLLDHPYPWLQYAMGLVCALFAKTFLLGLGMLLRRHHRAIGFNLMLLSMLCVWCYHLAIYSPMNQLQKQMVEKSNARPTQVEPADP